MSSESDDDFLSADEGSDLESENQKPPAQVLSSSRKPDTFDSSEEDDFEEKESSLDCDGVDRNKFIKKDKSEKSSSDPRDIQAEEEASDGEETPLIGVLKNLSLQVNDQLTHPRDVSDEALDDEEDDFDELEGVESPEYKFKTFSESLVVDSEKKQVGSEGDKTFSESLVVDGEKKQVGSEGDKGKEPDLPVMGISEDISNNIQEKNVEKNILDTNIKKPENKVGNVKACFSENNKGAVIEKQEEKEPTRLEDRSPIEESKLNESCGTNIHEAIDITEKKTDNERTIENILPINQKPKPLKESKIGKKKPRERLGERLGAKKLGSRIEKKPLESIAYENISKLSDEPVSVKKPVIIAKNLQEEEDTLKKEEEKRLQQQQQHLSEQEEERWQQVHNIGGRGKGDEFQQKESDSAWGAPWGNWGTTLISAASTFTQEVGRGVGSIMESVEGSLGVPDPETLAKEISEREKLLKIESETVNSANNTEDKMPNERDMENEGLRGDSTQVEEGDKVSASNMRDYGIGGLSSLGSLVVGVSGVFETAGSKVLLGGLDTLEVIGRKAMDAIQEGDPGLRKKRAFLTNAKPNLSAMLQEARHRAAEEEREQRGGGCGKSGKSSQSQRPTLDEAWEATDGCVHIEALSLVARQCESKMSSLLQSTPHFLVDRIQAANAEIRNSCELEEETPLEEDFVSRLKEIVPMTGLPIQPQKIIDAWSSVEETISLIKEAGIVDGPTAERELYAALAALVVQVAAVIHKGAEIAIITPEADPVNVAKQFKELSSVVCGGIENTADHVCGIITTEASAANPQINNTITNIYLQSSSGNGYIQQCMIYLSSILQYSNTKQIVAEL